MSFGYQKHLKRSSWGEVLHLKFDKTIIKKLVKGLIEVIDKRRLIKKPGVIGIIRFT